MRLSSRADRTARSRASSATASLPLSPRLLWRASPRQAARLGPIEGRQEGARPDASLRQAEVAFVDDGRILVRSHARRRFDESSGRGSRGPGGFLAVTGAPGAHKGLRKKFGQRNIFGRGRITSPTAPRTEHYGHVAVFLDIAGQWTTTNEEQQQEQCRRAGHREIHLDLEIRARSFHRNDVARRAGAADEDGDRRRRRRPRACRRDASARGPSCRLSRARSRSRRRSPGRARRRCSRGRVPCRHARLVRARPGSRVTGRTRAPRS